MLEEAFGLVQLSTGDLLRAAVAAGTDAGKQAKAVMEAGGLVSDDIVLAILKDRMADPDTRKGVILDGFPRTAGQAEALDGLLGSTGQRVNSVISMEVEDAPMIARVAGRYTCAACGEGYHDEFKQPAKAGVCDKCGGTDVQTPCRRQCRNGGGAACCVSRPDGTAYRLLRRSWRVWKRIDAMA